MGQLTFAGADFGFEWTEDWYEWDYKAGNKAALKARNALVKELKVLGCNPRSFALEEQLVSRGGIGSGRPHIELWCKCYGVNWDEPEYRPRLPYPGASDPDPRMGENPTSQKRND